jgi:hypothetical protein
MRIPLARWVAPFGDPGINDRSHLPRAFRSVPRPSSPLSAKASTRCPYLRLSATPNGKDHFQISECRYQRSEPSRQQTLLSEDTAGSQARPRSFAKPGRTRSPATVTQLASLRLSINKCLGLPHRGCTRHVRVLLTAFVLAPGAIAFRGLLRKPLSARTGGAAAHQAAERIGGGDRNRTDDPLLAKQVLSQLSYTPGATLVAPPASGVSKKRRKQTAATAPPPLSQFAAQTAVGVTLSCGKRCGGPGRI